MRIGHVSGLPCFATLTNQAQKFILEQVKKIKDGLSKLSNKKILIPAVLVLIIILGVSGFFITNGNLGSILGVTSNQKQDTEKVMNQIEKLIELPKNETPILATVSDATKLSNESFYQNAQNGDRVLVFKNSKMAILYRPSKNKIIKVGAVAVVEPKQGSTSAKPTGQAPKGTSTTPTPALLKVVIYNATKTPGLAKTTGDNLESKYQNMEVMGTANATGDYTKTLIVDLSGKNKSAAQTLAKELNGEIGSLPEGESKPNADILIIVASE